MSYSTQIETWQGSGVKTLYYQGMLSSQTQLAKYTGKRGFIATTGEHVVIHNGLEAILEPHVGIELEEVRLMNKQKWNDPITGLQHLITRLGNYYYGIQVTGGESNELSVLAHSLDFSKISVAQESDIETHKRKFDTISEEDSIILYGVSRGAATTFSSFCIHKYPNVKLVILEGCFYSVPHVFSKRYGTASSYLYMAAKWLLPSHREDGHSPGSLVDEFPEGIPVAFITSSIDTSVSPESTRKIAEELAKRGKNPVYLLELRKSRHPTYMFDDREDRDNYEFFLHALYKTHQLPHIPELANKGLQLLCSCLMKIN